MCLIDKDINGMDFKGESLRLSHFLAKKSIYHREGMTVYLKGLMSYI